MDIKQIARNIRSIARDGDDAEAKIAEKRLRQFLDKHHITEAELDEEDTQMFEFRYKEPWEQKLIWQLGYKVMNSTDSFYTRTSTGNHHRFKLVIIQCTKAQYVEITMMYNFYRRLFQAEVDDLFAAFVQKHELFGTPSDDSAPTEYDMEQLIRISKLEDALRSESYHKQLTAGDEA